jgi:D-mannonate dehydratase
VEKMGKIMKINMYSEMKRKKNNKLKLEVLEENILEYNIWLKKTNREDKIENYEKFLQAQ